MMKGRYLMKKTLALTLFICLVLTMATFPNVSMAESISNVSTSAIDLTPIFQALIALLAALITAKVIPWIKSKISNEQQLAMMATVRIMVYAAEQIYGSNHGDEKLAWVENALKEQGYKLDTKMIKGLIEAQVKELTMAQGVTNVT